MANNLQRISMLLVGVIISCVSALSFAQKVDITKEKTKVTVGADVWTFKSLENDTEYKLMVSIPDGYSADSEKKYPVLYVLDAQWDYVNMVSCFGNSHYDGFIPGIVIVGISYAGDNPDYSALRAYDMGPINWDKGPKSGGAKDFINVIRNEIFPFVENEYNVDPNDRGISGHSFGGIFTLYTLFKEPDMFNKYISINPALFWGDSLLFDIEQEYAEKNNSLDAKLYMSMSQYDWVAVFNGMLDNISSRGYKGLDLESRINDGLAHSTNKSEAFVRGLHFIYKKEVVEMPEVELLKYVGSYKVENEGYFLSKPVKIRIEKGHLVISNIWGMPDTELYGLKNGGFSWLKTHNKFEFTLNDNGEVLGMTMGLNRDYVLTAVKVD